MKLAIATDQDHVASGFGCSPFCTIVDIEDGHVRNSLLIPNPGGNHSFWADLFFRNAIKYVVAGSMGPTARAIMTGHGIQPVLGIKGPIDDVIRRFVAGELTPVATDAGDAAHADSCCECKG
jgi:predicted Fe-Mo cluster-binding NifX family protein